MTRLETPTSVGEKRIAEAMGWTWRIERPDRSHWCPSVGYDLKLGSWLKPGGDVLNDWKCVACDTFGTQTYPRYRNNLKELNKAAQALAGEFSLHWRDDKWTAYTIDFGPAAAGSGAIEEDAMWEMIHNVLDRRPNEDAN